MYTHQDPSPVRIQLFSGLNSRLQIGERLSGLASDAQFYDFIESRDSSEKQAIYFDASAIIDMLTALDQMPPGDKIDLEYFRNPINTVLGIAYRGWLGPIQLLPPHRDEVVDKINLAGDLFPDSPSFSYEQKRKDYLRVAKLDKLLDKKDNGIPKKDFGQLRDASLEAFVLTYFLHDRGHWKERYHYLNQQNIIQRFHKKIDYPIAEIIASNLFQDILEALNDFRPSRSRSNFVDAIALFLLEERLKSAIENNLPIPVFFSDQESLYHATKSMLRKHEEKSAKGEISDRPPFTIFDKKHRKFHSVVRNENYFILSGISRSIKTGKVVNQQLTKFRTALAEVQEAIDSIKANQSNRPLFKNVWNLSLLHFGHAFFDGWLSENAPKELGLITKEPSEQFQKRINAFIKEEREKLSAEKEIGVNRTKFIGKVWGALQPLEAQILTISRKRNENDDVVNHGKLVKDELESRFGMQQRVCIRVMEELDHLFELANDVNGRVSDSQEEYGRRIRKRHIYSKQIEITKGKIATRILGVIYRPDKEEVTDGQLDNLAHGLGLLWVLGQYNQITEIISLFMNSEPGNVIQEQKVNHFFPLIYAGALLEKSPSDFEAAKAIMEKELQRIRKSGRDNYHTKTGLSYLKYLIWTKRLKKYVRKGWMLPEQAVLRLGQNEFISVYDHLISGEAYARDAYDFLERKIDSMHRNDEPQEAIDYYQQKSDYLVNNILFFLTYSASAKRFLEEGREYASLLRGAVEDYNNADQPFRYYDTLSRYNLRRAVLSWEKEEARKDYLRLAKDDIHNALSNTDSKNRGFYKTHLQTVIDLINDPPAWVNEIKPFPGLV